MRIVDQLPVQQIFFRRLLALEIVCTCGAGKLLEAGHQFPTELGNCLYLWTISRWRVSRMASSHSRGCRRCESPHSTLPCRAPPGWHCGTSFPIDPDNHISCNSAWSLLCHWSRKPRTPLNRPSAAVTITNSSARALCFCHSKSTPLD